ncbi:hypothetical protein [Sphingomonas montana]|uniref:hypothetical protein n=1 Tax=Sphingomonas montana TaxID=1843236 RepID=UPI00101AD927|nr:hypothetical protein [Sphingomonas montana]
MPKAQPQTRPRDAAEASSSRLSIPEDARSPALDLQRRVESQVLRGFYAHSAPKSVGRVRRLMLATGIACTGWVLVFATGALLLK